MNSLLKIPSVKIDDLMLKIYKLISLEMAIFLKDKKHNRSIFFKGRVSEIVTFFDALKFMPSFKKKYLTK